MIKAIKMPDLGTNVEEIRVVRWIKQIGDTVARGDILMEVETDKSIMEVESYLSGFLKKILVAEGDAVPAGAEVALIGEPDDKIEE